MNFAKSALSCSKIGWHSGQMKGQKVKQLIQATNF